MKTLKITLLLISLNLFSFNALASEIKWTISGSVVEHQTNESIPYATVALYSKNDSTLIKGVITNDDGLFLLEKITEGNYYLKISFIGYNDLVIDTIILNENNRKIDLGEKILEPNIESLQEVTLVSKKKAIQSSVDKQVLNVSSNLSATGGTAVDALKFSPSIQTDSDGNVKLRGSSNFKVLINGKPTTLTSNEVLKQTPANMISKIEVITNPSVKYNAEGGAGIINIILKKNISSGFNGIINAMIGTKNKYSSDVNINLNKEKISYSIGFDWRDYTQTANNYYYRTLQLIDTLNYATMFQDREMTNSNLGFRFGLDYNPNEKNNITYSFHTGYTKSEAEIEAKSTGITIPSSTNIYRKSNFEYFAKPKFFTNNIGFSRQLDTIGSNLSLNAYYSYIDYEIYNKQIIADTDPDFNSLPEPFLQNINNDNHSDDLRIDADYTKVVSENTNLETGLSYHLYNRFLDITFANYDYDSNAWVNHPNYTDKYNFDESVYAAYFNVNSSFWGLQTSFGLRLEYMDRLLLQQRQNNRYDYDKVNVFPGISILKNLNDTNSLKFALTSRINRPDEYMMNPFPEFEDDFYISVGNPYLIPETVRNLELGYTYSKSNTMFSSNLYYRTTKDKIEQKLTVTDENKLLLMFHNDSEDRTVGLELMGNVDVTDWWTINANVNLFDYYISANIDGVKNSRTAFSWSSQLVNSFNITKTTSLQLTSFYNSETVRSQGELSDYYFMDAALKQQFLDGKLSVSLQYKDILQSLNYQLTTETANMNLLGDFNNESPIFLFNISYKLSNYKKKTRDVETDFDM